MRIFNIWTRLKKNLIRSNDGIHILGPKNSEGRVKEDITCCMRTFIIDCKTPIIYGLNFFFIPKKIGHF